MNRFNRMWIVAGLSAALSVPSFAADTKAALDSDGQVVVVSATWAEHFDSPSELAVGVDVIALGRVVAVHPGRLAYSDNGEDVIPFEEVELEVTKGVKGVRDLERITIERVGGIDDQGDTVVMAADGGPVEVGQSYFLFLRRQENGPRFYQVNGQGRYSVSRDHRLAESTNENDAVGHFFHDAKVDEAIGLIGDYLRKSSHNNDEALDQERERRPR